MARGVINFSFFFFFIYYSLAKFYLHALRCIFFSMEKSFIKNIKKLDPFERITSDII